jgi:hypothetical protein
LRLIGGFHLLPSDLRLMPNAAAISISVIPVISMTFRFEWRPATSCNFEDDVRSLLDSHLTMSRLALPFTGGRSDMDCECAIGLAEQFGPGPQWLHVQCQSDAIRRWSRLHAICLTRPSRSVQVTSSLKAFSEVQCVCAPLIPHTQNESSNYDAPHHETHHHITPNDDERPTPQNDDG